MKRQLDISDNKPSTENIKDQIRYGIPDMFELASKASSNEEGFMKSTKMCNVPGGSVMQVTTQQVNADGSYSLAEALTYVPGVHLKKTNGIPKLINNEY